MNIIGCHLSDRQGFMGMALQTTALHASSFQFFTRNPRGSHARAWDISDVTGFIGYAHERDIGPIVGYAPYTDNPAAKSMQLADFARMVTAEDLGRMEQIPHQLYVMHPGSATHETAEEGLSNIISLVNDVLEPSQTTTLCIVNSAGAGHEVAATFDDMAKILNGIQLKDHVGTCFDVVAAWGAGYDVKERLDDVLAQYDKVIGLDRMKVVHLADPRYELGTHHATHEPLGEGALGLDGLKAIYEHPRLAGKVFILETPHEDLEAYETALKALAE